MKQQGNRSLNITSETHRAMAIYAAQHGLQMYEVARLAWEQYAKGGAPPPVLEGIKYDTPVERRFAELVRFPRFTDPNPLVRAASFQAQSLALLLGSDDFPESEQK